MEVGLAAGLREAVVAHVAGSTASAYVGPWTHFVNWCASLAVPRCPLPASEITVALFLRSVVERSKSYGPVKSHSAAIAFYQKVNLFGHLPTRSPAVNMVRQAAARHFGLGTSNRKEPFSWAQVVAFALTHGVNSKGYCHLVVASMAVVMFGAMCRYDDVSHLRWRNIKFDNGYECFHIEFEKRKNDQYRQGNRVTVAAAPDGLVCPLKLLRKMMLITGGDADAFIFRGFNGRFVLTSPEKTAPGPSFISYAQFSKYLALWFGASLGLSPKEFSTVYGSQSGRSGAASAAANVGVSMELWGQHGDWKSVKSQKNYMKRDPEAILSVSRAAMTPVSAAHFGAPTPVLQVPQAATITPLPPTPGSFEDAPSFVEGVPPGSFAWQSSFQD